MLTFISRCLGFLTIVSAVGFCWANDDRSQTKILRGHQKSVADIEFSSDGTLLASISTDGETIIWNVASGLPQRAPSLARSVPAGEEYLKFTTEAESMLMAGGNPQGLVIDPRTLQVVSEWGDRTKLNVYPLIYAGGRRLVLRPAVKTAGDDATLFTVMDRDPKLLAISPDGTRLLTDYLLANSNYRQVQVLDATTGKVQCDLKAFTSNIEGIAWVDQNRVLTLVDGGAKGNSLMLWDVSGLGKLLAKVNTPPHANPPGTQRLTASADGQFAAAALKEGKVVIVEIGAEQLTLKRTLNAALYSVDAPTFSMSRNGSRLLAATPADSFFQLVVFDTHSGAELLVYKRKQDDTLPELSPDGRWVAVGHADGTISLLSVESTDAPASDEVLTQILDLPLEHPQAPGMPNGIRDLFRRFADGRVEVSAGGDVFAVHDSFDEKRVSVASTKSMKHWPVWETTSTRPKAAELPAWAVFQDGTLWVEGKWVGSDPIPKFFYGSVDPATGQVQLQNKSRSEQYTAIQPSPDNSLMAVCAGNWVYERPRRKQLPPNILLLDTKTGKPVRTLASDLEVGTRCRFVFSSIGSRLAVSENSKLRVFETATGAEVPLAGDWNSQRFWFVGEQILVRQEGESEIVGVNLETQAEVFRWQASEGQSSQVTCFELSADGRLAAVGGQNGDLTLRDPQTGAVLHRSSPFAAAIGGLGFSPDGTVLAAADSERRLIVWKVGNLSRPGQ